MCVHQRCGGHRQPSQDPEGNQRSAQRKQSPPHDLWRLPAAETRGLHILTIRAAFCSFSIKLTRSTLLVLVLFFFLYFFFHVSFSPPIISVVALRPIGSDPLPARAVTRVRTAPRAHPTPPPPPFLFFSLFLSISVVIRSRPFCLCRPSPVTHVHIWLRAAPQAPPPHPPNPHPIDSRYLYPCRSLLPQDKTPSIQNQTRKYFCFYFTKQLLICF